MISKLLALNTILVLRLGTAGRTVGRPDPRLDGWVVGLQKLKKQTKKTKYPPKTKIQTLVERYWNVIGLLLERCWKVIGTLLQRDWNVI